MLGRWICYVRLGMLDLVRLWSTTQHHVIIVAGICLPILLLLGLKRGHVAELRRALLTSPTGRQIVFGSGQRGDLLTPDGVRHLEQELPGVEVIIPDVYRLVNLHSQPKGGRPRTLPGVTLFATAERDPLLAHLDAVLPRAGERLVVLGRAAAEQLGVSPGDDVTAEVIRQSAGAAETATLRLKVSSAVEMSGGTHAGYVDVSVLDRMAAYVQGFRVAEYGWPAGGNPAAARYRTWLAFCRKDSDFTADDRSELELQYRVTDVTNAPPEGLVRVLDPAKRADLRIYRITARDPEQELDDPAAPGVYDPEATTADEVLVPWAAPLTRSVGGRTWTLVGLTNRRIRWMRGYLRPEAGPPSSAEDALQVRAAEAGRPVEGKTLDLPLRTGENLSLRLLADGQKASSVPGVLGVVPPEVLAWLAAHEAGRLEYDAARRLFVPAAPAPRYNRARLYAETIDDVPALVDALTARDFSVSAEQVRIREIHRQDASLQLLVVVVGAGVFLFGVLTVVSVLHDSTDRKRATIGILRVMGTSRRGIFLLIFIRATVIGLLASLLCGGLGMLLAWGLTWTPPEGSWWASWKPAVAVELHWRDHLLVLAGALLCCAAGAVWPAWRASRLDPAEAIVEGRFR